MNVNLMLLRAPCPGPGGGIRGTGRGGGTGCPVPGQCAGNTGGRAPPAPQDLMICSRQPLPVPSSAAASACGHSPQCRHDHKLKQHPAGKSTSYPTEQSGGPLPRAGATPLNPPATRS